MIEKNRVSGAMNYEAYRNLLQDLLASGKTTGPNQSEEYLNYAKLNLQRMLRLEKTVELSDQLMSALNSVSKEQVWLVLTEGWCGDAAQNIPVFHAIEKACPKIRLKLILRDENLDIMDQYLTGSSRSIPKLIAMEADTMKELFTWGPRPEAIQELVMELKHNNTPPAEKGLIVQKWYNQDKTLSIQKELATLIRQPVS